MTPVITALELTDYINHDTGVLTRNYYV